MTTVASSGIIMLNSAVDKRLHLVSSDEGILRKKRLRRRVRFSFKTNVIGRADIGIDREPMPIQLFVCDVCGENIHAGLRGFEIYATCKYCEFDICLKCCEFREPPRYSAHPHPLSLVDRNTDIDNDDDDNETYDQGENETDEENNRNHNVLNHQRNRNNKKRRRNSI
mmetsp:Transcript_20019/g.24260  ORF Transcript_20019/g.24260 Transcript_20019/m.24260 type:complete len:168 (+) Transcript_20019:90-593(+)